MISTSALTKSAAGWRPGVPERRAPRTVAERWLLEQFRPWVRNETVAIRHLHLWQRLRVNDRRLGDDIALGEDVGRNAVNFVIAERTRRRERHGAPYVIEQRRGVGPIALDSYHRVGRRQRATAADEAQRRSRRHIGYAGHTCQVRAMARRARGLIHGLTGGVVPFTGRQSFTVSRDCDRHCRNLLLGRRRAEIVFGRVALRVGESRRKCQCKPAGYDCDGDRVVAVRARDRMRRAEASQSLHDIVPSRAQKHHVGCTFFTLPSAAIAQLWIPFM